MTEGVKMIESIQALWNEWCYARNLGYLFLTEVSDVDLQKTFPRKNLNTILAQYNELYEIQQDYVDAIELGKIRFTGRNLHLTSAAELVDKMKDLDQKLKSKLSDITGCEYVDWFGEKYNIHQHICAMISHEMMHIGQVVAFCYATNITIPHDIIKIMALSG